MIPDKVIGVRLQGGPERLDGWSNAYDAESLGGWPPPEELMAFSLGAQVVIALPENVPAKHRDMASLYRKIQQSSLPEPGEHIFRGALYEYMPTDD